MKQEQIYAKIVDGVLLKGDKEFFESVNIPIEECDIIDYTDTKQKLTKKIIEAIHGKPWEELTIELFGIKAFGKNIVLIGEKVYIIKQDNEIIFREEIDRTVEMEITLSQVLQAFNNKEIPIRIDTEGEFMFYKNTKDDPDDDIGYIWKESDIFWKFITDDKQTATLDDQTDETIDKLLELFN